ncbi:sepiapterin reductase b [Colossoma macropomum]|uniref:sepiapterin reductase b n=1 Tax=Colossoma macropomum TaxID=42526 RepID=UPI0018640D02|nr:sepiapterin reductase b [Colossoma macropomum]
MEDITTEGNRDLGKALCIITGASRGFGRTLALQVACLVKPQSVLLLVARSVEQLKELREDIVTLDAGQKRLVVHCVQADLEKKEGVEKTVRAAQQIDSSVIDHLLIINNAGSLGDVSRFTLSFTDPVEVNHYLSLNVSSTLSLTAGVLQAFPRRMGLQRTVVNISSLCALKAFPSWVLYCTGKAARDMIFRVLAAEEPDIRVLNYAPGPLDTDMQAEARYRSGNMKLRCSFSSMFFKGQLVSCQESGAKLMRLLLDNDYPSGAHVDFFEL